MNNTNKKERGSISKGRTATHEKQKKIKDKTFEKLHNCMRDLYFSKRQSSVNELIKQTFIFHKT